MSEENKVIRKRFHFSGAVQGVGFRYRMNHAANGCMVTGWVKNEWDGSVIAELQGSERQINEVLKMVNRGSYISIDNMDTTILPVDEDERGFHIR